MTPEEAVEESRRNPIAFNALMIGRPVGRMHAELISYLLDDKDCYIELPRGHGKTTTGALTLAWLLGHFPSLRVKVVGCTDTESTKTSSMIREIIENPKYKAVFPHIQIRSKDTSKAAWRLTGANKGSRDPTVEALGIMGRAGGRFDILWTDDISDLRNAVLMPAEREKVKEAYYSNWMPMRDIASKGPFKPRVWNTATPYHTDDITGDLRKLHTDYDTIFRRPCVVENGRRVSPWAEVFNHDALEDQYRRMGALAYGRAYELVPLSSDLLIFRPEWFQYYRQQEVPRGTRTVAAIDWGYGRAEQSGAQPDYSVCIVGEIDGERNLYLTDVLRVREPFPVFVRMATALLERRGVSVVLAEGNGPQRGIYDQFRTMTTLPCVCVERNRDKHIRAAGSQPFIQAGKLLFPMGDDGKVTPSFNPVVEEMVAFPAAAHDDVVDVVTDLCTEAVRGSITSVETMATNFEKADPVARMFGRSSIRRPFFA